MFNFCRNPIYGENRQGHKYRYLKEKKYNNYDNNPRFKYMFDNKAISERVYQNTQNLRMRRNSTITNLKNRYVSY